jgi:formylmethanofuran dehydrogenase subunit E
MISVSEEMLKSNPRIEINELIQNNDYDKLLIKAAQIHGHYCPGLAMGVMAGTYAIQKFNVKSDGLEDLLAIVETNNCFSDGIQFVTACTFGNNSLIFRDYGKTAFTLIQRGKSGIKISVKKDAKKSMQKISPEFSQSYEIVVKNKKHSDSETQRFKKLGLEKAFAILNLDITDIFKIEDTETVLPEYAPSHESIICELCGENVMEIRIINKNSQQLCIPCGEGNYFQLDGSGILQISSSNES